MFAPGCMPARWLVRGRSSRRSFSMAPPGVGKTRFMRRLSEILGMAFHGISMASDPLKLTGLSAGWGTARPGEVARFFGRNLSANPLFMLDEIDKCGSMQSQDAHLPSIHELLLSLLEQETSRNLTDEYLEFRLDASHISWVCTSNEVWRLPEPLLSRLTVFDIAAPDRSQMLAVAQSCYRDVRAAEPFGELFHYRLPDALTERLAAQSPRVISRMLVTTMERQLWAECRDPGRRVAKGSLALDARYLPETAMARPTMGFV
jgi:ATP-dependent Lon protease